MRWNNFFKELTKEARDPLMKKAKILKILEKNLSVKERLRLHKRIERITDILYRQKGLPINEYYLEK